MGMFEGFRRTLDRAKMDLQGCLLQLDGGPKHIEKIAALATLGDIAIQEYDAGRRLPKRLNSACKEYREKIEVKK